MFFSSPKPRPQPPKCQRMRFHPAKNAIPLPVSFVHTNPMRCIQLIKALILSPKKTQRPMDALYRRRCCRCSTGRRRRCRRRRSGQTPPHRPIRLPHLAYFRFESASFFLLGLKTRNISTSTQEPRLREDLPSTTSPPPPSSPEPSS